MTTEAEETLMEAAVSVKPSGRFPNGSELDTARWTWALGMQKHLVQRTSMEMQFQHASVSGLLVHPAQVTNEHQQTHSRQDTSHRTETNYK